MSRTIKYRVWDNENKSYSDPYSSAYYAMAQDGGLDFYCHGDHMRGADPDVYFIEQYTGLTDKNGKEIYEGDRIKIEGSDTVYTVEYGRGVWVARFGDESGDNICLFHYVQKDMVLYAEVIGNVHEPPKDFRPEHLKRMGVSISKGVKE